MRVVTKQHRVDPELPIEDVAGILKAWSLAQRCWIGLIPGTTKPHRLGENLGGADIGHRVLRS